MELRKTDVHTILIVDDDDGIRWILKECLEGIGFDVIAAESGEAALEHIKENDFDLIISDLNMPKGDGYWLLSQIKDKAHAPVMIISGETVPCNKLRAMGAVGLLPKPHKKEDLYSIVDFLLGSCAQNPTRFHSKSFSSASISSNL